MNLDEARYILDQAGYQMIDEGKVKDKAKETAKKVVLKLKDAGKSIASKVQDIIDNLSGGSENDTRRIAKHDIWVDIRKGVAEYCKNDTESIQSIENDEEFINDMTNYINSIFRDYFGMFMINTTEDATKDTRAYVADMDKRIIEEVKNYIKVYFVTEG